MKSKEKIKNNTIEEELKQQNKREMFTWMHRYLRLHDELLSDEDYKNIYDYLRDSLVECLEKDMPETNFDNQQLGSMIDTIADIFNKKDAEQSEKLKPLVDEFYKIWKENPDAIKKTYS